MLSGRLRATTKEPGAVGRLLRSRIRLVRRAEILWQNSLAIEINEQLVGLVFTTRCPDAGKLPPVYVGDLQSLGPPPLPCHRPHRRRSDPGAGTRHHHRHMFREQASEFGALATAQSRKARSAAPKRAMAHSVPRRRACTQIPAPGGHVQGDSNALRREGGRIELGHASGEAQMRFGTGCGCEVGKPLRPSPPGGPD
jgi:hypothetical protein